MFIVPTSLIITILSVVAVICLYLALNHAINDYFQYKYMETFISALKDDDTRKLFIYLRPYISKYLDLLNEKVKAYVRDVGSLGAYRQFLQEISEHTNKSKNK